MRKTIMVEDQFVYVLFTNAPGLAPEIFILVTGELYPVLILAKLNPANSITIYNAASSSKTLALSIGLLGGKLRLDESSY